MDTLVVVNASLVGLFAFATIHYAVKWWFSSDERVLLFFAILCGIYVVVCFVMASYFRAVTVSDAQVRLDMIVTLGAITHAVVLHFYSLLGGRRDRVFRWVITCLMAFVVVLSQWVPLRGTVIELRIAPLPWGTTGLLPVLSPPSFGLVLLYAGVIAIHGYGLLIAGTKWKRDRAGALLIAAASISILAGATIGILIDFAKVRAPYVGALPHAIFVVLMALYFAREYASRGVRLAASERRVARSLEETRQALVDLEAQHRLLEESESARAHALEALVQAQRKELASQLAAGAAHDFDNVLSVISVWSHVLLNDSLSADDREKARQGLENAQAQGQSLSRQLMALARPDSRSVKRIPIERPIHTAVQTLVPVLPLNIRLNCEAPMSLEIDADESEIQQVVYNLVLNSRDAMPDGGDIQITGGVETSSVPIAVVGGSLGPGPWATLSVTDSGPGVEPTIREQIFDPFFTTKGQDGGTGLGLATVLRIAKAHGGGVTLENLAGRGATFKLYLPTCDGSRPPESEIGSLDGRE